MSRGLVNNMLTMNNLGDGSTLSLDFTTMGGVLDPRLTFTRASTVATYVNSSGYVATATTNEPRFDYNPTTIGVPRGLLIEAQATNLLKYSSYADTNWLITGGYLKSYITGITSPANDTSAARITFSAVGHGLYTNNTLMGYTNTVGATYTWSAWIRATGGTTNLNIRFGDSAVALGANIPITTTWTRYSYSYTAVAGSGPYIASASGTATGEFEMWGFQLEAGSGASSYIPTVASQVTRNAEECRMTGTNFSSWFAGATEGVFFAEYEKPRKLGSQDYVALSTVYAPGALLNITTNTNTLWPSCICWPTGGAVFPGGITTACPAITKRAVRWFDGNDFTNFADGVVGTASNGTGTLTMTMLNVGASTNSGTASTGDWLNSCVRKIKFYPSALPNDQIQNLTAP
jgi:hypothetical protein